MPETKEEAERRRLEELKGRNIAHYQVLLSAWISTRMERDKTIITLSSAAIALLVTIITTVHLKSLLQYLFASLALTSFLGTICICLLIYQLNTKHLEECLRDNSETNTSKLLNKLDLLTTSCFHAGIIFAIMTAIFISVQQKGGSPMSEPKKNVETKITPLKESLTGLNKLAPKDIETGSFSGLSSLSPNNVPPSPSPTTQNSSGNAPTNEGKK